MLFRNRVVLMTGMTFALVAGTVAAQAPADIHEHRGFWIGFGLGGGVNLSEGLDGERLGGGDGYLRIGGTESQRVLLGFAGIFWGRDENGTSIARGNSSFAMLFYRSGRGGGFIKRGLGWSNIARVTKSGNSTTTTTKSGFGLTLGTGWDVRLGHNLYLTPNLDFLFQAFSSEVDPVLGEIPGTNTILLFTLGLTWH